MKIVTNLAIPDDVYLFYLKVSQNFEKCTAEDAIVEALTRYAAIISKEILNNHSSKSENPPNPNP